MIICAYDLETTGLSKQNDRMIEVGLALYSTGQHKFLESVGFLVQSDGVAVSEEITQLTGVTQPACDKFGYEPTDALEDIISFMSQADAVAAHNGIRFDMPFTDATSQRLNKSIPRKLVIDTMYDIPGVDGEKLITMCAQCPRPFINPYQHSALDDCKSVIGLMTAYDVEAVIQRASSPMIVVRSHQHRGNNDDAKKFKFRWNPENKIWWKAIKQEDLAGLTQKVPFDVSVLDKPMMDELMNS